MAQWLCERRKKNLITYLNAQDDTGWSLASCDSCKYEKIDYIDGQLPCRATGKCKYFGNKSNVPEGDLRRYTVGIEKFLEVAQGLSILIPLDPQGYPCAPPTEIDKYGRTVDLGEDMFFELMETYLSVRQKNISDQRARERQHGGRT